MNLDNDIIFAYLWLEIERQAFSPKKDKDKDKKIWLNCYLRSLKTFWGLSDYPVVPSNWIQNNTIEHNGVNLAFRHQIESLEKYWVKIWDHSKTLKWTHDVDGVNFFDFPRQKFLTIKQGKQAIREFNQKQINTVFDCMICHPKVHQHIESPINEHEIRIGGGISNPYLYLFQLRFQLCINKQQREKEKERLASLFNDKIKNKKAIPAGDLFAI